MVNWLRVRKVTQRVGLKIQMNIDEKSRADSREQRTDQVI